MTITSYHFTIFFHLALGIRSSQALYCEGPPSAGCTNGLWNEKECKCECITPYCTGRSIGIEAEIIEKLITDRLPNGLLLWSFQTTPISKISSVHARWVPVSFKHCLKMNYFLYCILIMIPLPSPVDRDLWYPSKPMEWVHQRCWLSVVDKSTQSGIMHHRTSSKWWNICRWKIGLSKETFRRPNIYWRFARNSRNRQQFELSLRSQPNTIQLNFKLIYPLI